MCSSFAAIEEALEICKDPARDTNNPDSRRFHRHLPGTEMDFSGLNGGDNATDNEIHYGYCFLNFYSSLIDLLGRCAPEQSLIMQNKAEALRIRMILRSLVPYDDLVGIISLPFELPRVEKVTETVIEPIMNACFIPDHKASVLLFLERVYGIEDLEKFMKLIELGFLGDIRSAAQLDTSNLCCTDMALALNRYLCSAVLPLITKHTELLEGTVECNRETLLDSLLHSIYRLSKGRAMTKAQKDVISDCLVSLAGVLQPSLMHGLLRKLTFDVPALTEQTMIPIRLLTLHYERCWQYYCLSGGLSSVFTEFGVATDEERHLTMMLFWGIFDALAKKVSETAKKQRIKKKLMHDKIKAGANFIGADCSGVDFASQLSLEIQPNRDSKSSNNFTMSSIVNTVQAIGEKNDIIQGMLKMVRDPSC